MNYLESNVIQYSHHKTPQYITLNQVSQAWKQRSHITDDGMYITQEEHHFW